MKDESMLQGLLNFVPFQGLFMPITNPTIPTVLDSLEKHLESKFEGYTFCASFTFTPAEHALDIEVLTEECKYGTLEFLCKYENSSAKMVFMHTSPSRELEWISNDPDTLWWNTACRIAPVVAEFLNDMD